jgi:hypothetical protein
VRILSVVQTHATTYRIRSDNQYVAWRRTYGSECGLGYISELEYSWCVILLDNVSYIMIAHWQAQGPVDISCLLLLLEPRAPERCTGDPNFWVDRRLVP